MRKLIFYLIGLISFAGVQGQNVKRFDFKDFSELEISSTFEVEITQSEEYFIELTFEEELDSYILVELSENELKIGLKNWRGNLKSSPKAIIHLPSLESIEISGATTVNILKLNVEELEIELSGASDINGEVNVRKLEADISGASSLNLGGIVNKGEIYLSGVSEFNNDKGRITDELIFDASGASSALCVVDGDIYLNMSGASSFTYSGKGDIIKQESSGGSTIKKN